MVCRIVRTLERSPEVEADMVVLGRGWFASMVLWWVPAV